MRRAALALLAALSAAVFAEGATPAPLLDALQMSRLVEAFSDFAGSAQNAQSLAEGLHNGAAITLIDPSNAPRSFAPVTKPMSWRDVRAALTIAQGELASAGISQPTPVDIEAVLNGGTAGSGVTMTNFTGVLTQRWSGLGWHQIALAHNLNSDLLAGSTSKPVRSDMTHEAAFNSSPVRAGAITAGATMRAVAAVVQ